MTLTLDSVRQRHKLINEMIDKAIKYNEILSEYEDDLDWGGAKVALDDLAAIEQLVCAEEIFIETFNKLSSTPHSSDEEKDELLEIFSEQGVKIFVYAILLNRLEYLLKTMNDWGFRTKDGEEFLEYLRVRLEALIAKYKDYDVAAQSFDDAPPETSDILDTNSGRLKVVMDLYDRAKKIADDFRENEQTKPATFGDILGVTVMMERLMALREFVRTEGILRVAIEGVHKVADVSEETREKFVSVFAGQSWVFIRVILCGHIERTINFADNKFNDSRLNDFQKDFRETLEELRDCYADIYGV